MEIDNQTEEIIKQNIDRAVKKIFRQLELEGRQTYLNKYFPKEPKERKTYSQDWKTYEQACAQEKLMFLRLLKDAVDYMNIGYNWVGNGRPPAYFGDIVKCICIKAYHNLSSWRSPSELKIAKAMGIIDNVPKRSTLLKYMQDERITKMLHKLYKILAEPLVTVEKYFAVDASGISNTYGNTRWMKIRHTSAEHTRRKEFSKINVFSGVKTNVISAVEITNGNRHESPGFKPLLDETVKIFDVHEVYADAGYLSRDNVKACAKLDITPYIWGKKNVHVTKKGRATPWNSMLREWKFQRDFFVQRYHLRSNAESTFAMIKRKYGDFVRSKHETAIKNEILGKIVCHNGVVLAEAWLSRPLNHGFMAT